MAAKTRKEIGTESQKKGQDFERAFAEYMLRELGYIYAKPKSVHSAISARGIDVDIIGKRRSNTGAFLITVSYVFLGIMIALGIFIAIFFNRFHSNEVSVFLVILATLLVLGLILWGVSNRFLVEYTWVECKSGNDPADKDMVVKMEDNFLAHKANKHKKFRFTEKIFVSANGFNDTAYELAEYYRIICYICVSERFEIYKE